MPMSEPEHRKEGNREGGCFSIHGRLAQRGHGGIPEPQPLRGVQGLRDKLMLKLDGSNVPGAVCKREEGQGELGDMVQV